MMGRRTQRKVREKVIDNSAFMRVVFSMEDLATRSWIIHVQELEGDAFELNMSEVRQIAGNYVFVVSQLYELYRGELSGGPANYGPLIHAMSDYVEETPFPVGGGSDFAKAWVDQAGQTLIDRLDIDRKQLTYLGSVR